jgi:hypothetical protein
MLEELEGGRSVLIAGIWHDVQELVKFFFFCVPRVNCVNREANEAAHCSAKTLLLPRV